MAIVVIGFEIVVPAKNAKGLDLKPKAISPLFTVKDAAMTFLDLAKKEYPQCYLSEKYGVDDI